MPQTSLVRAITPTTTDRRSPQPGRIIHLFQDADMRNGHRGLFMLAKKSRIDVRVLDAGEVVVFINRKKTQVKVFGANHVVAHYKSPSGCVDLIAVRNIPKIFSSGSLNFDEAIKQRLIDLLGKKSGTIVG